MSKKIAVLVNEDTMQRCSCGGCLKAYMNKVDSFERYADEDTELVGFTHSGGDLEKKLASFKKNGGAVSKDGKVAIELVGGSNN